MGGRQKVTEKASTNKRMPVLRTDEEAEAFLEQDLSDYIWAGNLAPFPEWLRPRSSGAPKLKTRVKTRRQASR